MKRMMKCCCGDGSGAGKPVIWTCRLEFREDCFDDCPMSDGRDQSLARSWREARNSFSFVSFFALVSAHGGGHGEDLHQLGMLLLKVK